ncbi:MAG: hypothetical protein GY757_56585 [bacterium]|nr:hypothetical protein [bacterium]
MSALILPALDSGKKLSQYTIKTWNMESGLPVNTIYAIHQTRDGYLWVGTKAGLLRFDGLNFQLYNQDRCRL